MVSAIIVGAILYFYFPIIQFYYWQYFSPQSKSIEFSPPRQPFLLGQVKEINDNSFVFSVAPEMIKHWISREDREIIFTEKTIVKKFIKLEGNEKGEVKRIFKDASPKELKAGDHLVVFSEQDMKQEKIIQASKIEIYQAP